MLLRLTLVTLVLASLAFAGCGGEGAASGAEPKLGASVEVQRLVAEIDTMLAVPQEEYPDGNDYSAVFEQLFDAVVQQQRTLRTDRVAKNMGYFIATGHGIGWDPQQADIERLAANWSEFRPDVVAGH